MKSEETTDDLQAYGLKIIQPRHGYRFSLDPLLLCDFARIREGETAVDLGVGCGIIPLVLAKKAENTTISGIESQEELAELAIRNVSLNGLTDRISIENGDVALLKNHFTASSFDLVLSNPPYRKRGTGRISPKPGRDNARHESTASLADFLAAAKYLVRLSGRILLHLPSGAHDGVFCRSVGSQAGTAAAAHGPRQQGCGGAHVSGRSG